MEAIYKRTWAEIDLDAIANNYAVIRASLQPQCRLCCVIKADAYGHGAIRLAQAFEELGADYLGVSNIEEALQLRNAKINAPILILGYTPPEAAPVLISQNIAQCVYSKEYAAALAEATLGYDDVLHIHLKFDTGMNRLGFRCQTPDDEAKTIEAVMDIQNMPQLFSEGAFTHFALADEGHNGDPFTNLQSHAFTRLLSRLADMGIRFPLCHCANSGAVLDYASLQMDMVRTGIILYGLFPSGNTENRLPLKPALALKSTISHVKWVKPGETMSYGRIFTAQDPMRIATVPIGYADGYPRILGEKRAEALVSGIRCKITGRICMDQLMLDVTALPEVNIGDEVTLIGKDGLEEITADEIAAYVDTINYEVVCDIGKRVPRVYMKGKQIESIANHLLS